MEKTVFKIVINAPREKVWNTLWDDSSYREWTSVFSEGSKAETDWKEGSKVLFLDSQNSGMVSVIAQSRPFEYISFKHLGVVKNGVEDLDNPEYKDWKGALENYTLESINGSTELTVDMNFTGIPKEMLDYFLDTWPKALEKLKELGEKN